MSEPSKKSIVVANQWMFDLCPHPEGSVYRHGCSACHAELLAVVAAAMPLREYDPRRKGLRAEGGEPTLHNIVCSVSDALANLTTAKEDGK